MVTKEFLSSSLTARFNTPAWLSQVLWPLCAQKKFQVSLADFEVDWPPITPNRNFCETVKPTVIVELLHDGHYKLQALSQPHFRLTYAKESKNLILGFSALTSWDMNDAIKSWTCPSLTSKCYPISGFNLALPQGLKFRLLLHSF